jgi:outer membrane protein OmpA-like peptidoglycan-associated protein
MSWVMKYLVTVPVGLGVAVGVALVLVAMLWPQGKGIKIIAMRAAAVLLALLGAAGGGAAYYAAYERQDAEASKNAQLMKDMANVRKDLTNALAEHRVQEAKLQTLERTASEQKQIDAQKAADLEADLKKAMEDMGAMFNERNGVIELVLKDAIVNFDTDASTLQCGSKEKLSRVVGAISRVLDAVDDITIVGHTDLRGSAEHNKMLSKQRADAVVAYLAQSGIPKKMMTGVGKSYLQPAGFDDEQSMTVIKKANSDDKEMAENRRVQLLIRRKAVATHQQ